jgi:ribonuclease Z
MTARSATGWNGTALLCFLRRHHAEPVLRRQRKNADLVVHEAFNTVSQLMERSGYDERMAKGIGTIAHTAPSEVGHVLDAVNPRHAAIYHFFNDFDTAFEIERDVRGLIRARLAWRRT